MPGGHPEAWSLVKDVLQAVAAKVDGVPCCDWVGPDGAGHFVKMVHNGIEYGDMQLIAEAYHLMDQVLGMDAATIGDVFAQWDEGRLDSYLIEITADIFRAKDEDGAPLVEKILDAAGQKGTGKWTATEALEHGVPLTLISEAVFARFLSALKDERVRAAKVLQGPGARGSDRASGGQAADRSDEPNSGAELGRGRGRRDDARQPLGGGRIVRRRHRGRTVRVEDRVVRARLHAHAGRGGRLRLGHRLRRGGADVARRVHHPFAVLE